MESEFEKKMGNLDTPKTHFVKHHEMLKIGLMNARKSSKIGIIFILIPILFLVVAYIKIHIMLSIDYSATIHSLQSNTEQLGFLKWLLPIVFFILPLIAIAINLMAIMHFYVNNTSKELVITIKYELKNTLVLIVSFLIIISFICFVFIENVHFK